MSPSGGLRASSLRPGKAPRPVPLRGCSAAAVFAVVTDLPGTIDPSPEQDASRQWEIYSIRFGRGQTRSGMRRARCVPLPCDAGPASEAGPPALAAAATGPQRLRRGAGGRDGLFLLVTVRCRGPGVGRAAPSTLRGETAHPRRRRGTQRASELCGRQAGLRVRQVRTASPASWQTSFCFS